MSGSYFGFKRFFLWLFIAILSISFIAYFGLTGGTIGASSDAVQIGSVDGIPIRNGRYQDFAMLYQQIAEPYVKQGIDINNEQANAQIAQAAFYQTILGVLAEKQNKKNKLFLSDSQVVQYIKQTYFNRNFQKFNSFMKSSSITVKRAVENVSRRQAQRSLIEKTFWNYVPSSKILLNLWIDATRKEKKALVAYAAFNDKINSLVSEDQLKKYFQENKERYSSSAPINPSNFNPQTKPQPVSYQSVAQVVKKDYLIQNSQQLRQQFKNQINFELQSVQSKLNSNPSEKQFQTIVQNLGLKTIETDFLQLFSKKTFPKNDFNPTENAFPIQIPPPQPPEKLIEYILLTKTNHITKVVENDKAIFLAYILKQRINPNASSKFVTRQYKSQLQKDKIKRISANYFNNLYKNAKILFLGREQ